MIKVMRRILCLTSVFFCVFILAGMAGSGIGRDEKDETYKELELFADALAFIQTQYVEETKPEELIYGAMRGMVRSLDSHSQFLSPQEYQELKVETSGKFGGIGIEITVKEGLLTIITPIEGTPAWDAGLESNDRIIKIDDEVIEDVTLSEMVKKLRGEPGTKVTIVVWRQKDEKLHTFTIEREIINVEDIKEARILEDQIGYLKIVEFREDTLIELDKVLKDLKDEGLKSLILDLRNNPGGLLDKAIEVSERFLSQGAEVVKIRGRKTKRDIEYKADYGDPVIDIPLVILVNSGSASGSEIMAGAIQDHKRGIILGSTTFGKGSVQTVLPLRDGSAIKLTTSRYLTPLGRSIHDIGITPDIEIEQKRCIPEIEKDEDSKKIFEKVKKKTSKDEKDEALRELYASDPQLSRAVDLLKSMKVCSTIFGPYAKKD
jgi:carboxyl-terminal processing protease